MQFPKKQICRKQARKHSQDSNNNMYPSLKNVKKKLLFEDGAECSESKNNDDLKPLVITSPAYKTNIQNSLENKVDFHRQTVYKNDKCFGIDVDVSFGKGRRTTVDDKQKTLQPRAAQTTKQPTRYHSPLSSIDINGKSYQTTIKNNMFTYDNVLYNDNTELFQHFDMQFNNQKIQQLQNYEQSQQQNFLASNKSDEQLGYIQFKDEHIQIHDEQSSNYEVQQNQVVSELADKFLEKQKLEKKVVFGENQVFSHRKNLQSLEHFSEGFFANQQNNFSGVTLTQSELDFMGGENRNSFLQSKNTMLNQEINNSEVDVFLSCRKNCNFQETQELNTNNKLNKNNSNVSQQIRIFEDISQDKKTKNTENSEFSEFSKNLMLQNPLFSPVQTQNQQCSFQSVQSKQDIKVQGNLRENLNRNPNSEFLKAQNLQLHEENHQNSKLQNLELLKKSYKVQKELSFTPDKSVVKSTSCQVRQLNQVVVQQNQVDLCNKSEGGGRGSQQLEGDPIEMLIHSLDVSLGDKGQVCFEDWVAGLEASRSTNNVNVELRNSWRLLKMSKIALQMLTDEIRQQNVQIFEKESRCAQLEQEVILLREKLQEINTLSAD